jgi:bifunctional DNA-binding transcriptional regulator/antitoxin component of YhaV-PrlF toxin-antitoxin module
MRHIEMRMSADGMLAVPEAVRTAFNLKAGDTVDFYLDETARTARIRARNLDLSAIAEMFPLGGQTSGQPLSIEDMDTAIGDHLREDDERIKRDFNEWEEFQQWRRSRHRAAE